MGEGRSICNISSRRGGRCPIQNQGGCVLTVQHKLHRVTCTHLRTRFRFPRAMKKAQNDAGGSYMHQSATSRRAAAGDVLFRMRWGVGALTAQHEQSQITCTHLRTRFRFPREMKKVQNDAPPWETNQHPSQKEL